MAANTEIKKRPQIEISFKGLTLTLRAKNKTSIKVCNWKNQAWPCYCCNGSISSWEDNVSFCSCRESNWMQDDWFDSYQWEKRVHPNHFKKIINGNLTVEGNLWLGANCRYAIHISSLSHFNINSISFLSWKFFSCIIYQVSVDNELISNGNRKAHRQ